MGGGNPQAWGEQYRTVGYGRDLGIIVDGIRSRAPEARVWCFYNPPNGAAIPSHEANRSVTEKRILQAISVRFAARGQQPGGARRHHPRPDVRSAQLHRSRTTRTDGFHPSDSRLRPSCQELALNAINSGSGPAPRASCPQMSLAP